MRGGDENHSLFTGKATNRALKVINGMLNFHIFLTPALTLALAPYTKNTVT